MRFGKLIGSALGVTLLCAGLSLPLMVEAQTTPDASTARIQVLNGRTGRPLANQKIILMSGDGKPGHTTHHLVDVVTDGEGYAPLPNLDASVRDMSVMVALHQPCSKTGVHGFSLAKVHATGIVSENSCKPRITMYPQAGTLIFYVRDETFIEKMQH
jgi:hypothetical protein